MTGEIQCFRRVGRALGERTLTGAGRPKSCHAIASTVAAMEEIIPLILLMFTTVKTVVLS